MTHTDAIWAIVRASDPVRRRDLRKCTLRQLLDELDAQETAFLVLAGADAELGLTLRRALAGRRQLAAMVKGAPLEEVARLWEAVKLLGFRDDAREAIETGGTAGYFLARGDPDYALDCIRPLLAGSERPARLPRVEREMLERLNARAEAAVKRRERRRRLP